MKYQIRIENGKFFIYDNKTKYHIDLRERLMNFTVQTICLREARETSYWFKVLDRLKLGDDNQRILFL